MAITDANILYGLSAADTRRKTGSASATDLQNLQYAESQGWSPTSTQSYGSTPTGALSDIGTNPYDPSSEEYSLWEKQYGKSPTPPQAPPVTGGSGAAGAGAGAEGAAGGAAGTQQGGVGAFGAALSQMKGYYEGISPMQEQKRKILKQLYDQPLTPEEMRTLSPQQQAAIRDSDRSQLEYQVMTLTDQIKGRSDSNQDAIKYLIDGYKFDQEQAAKLTTETEQKRDNARSIINTMISQYGSAITEDPRWPQWQAEIQRTGEYPPEMLTELSKTLREQGMTMETVTTIDPTTGAVVTTRRPVGGKTPSGGTAQQQGTGVVQGYDISTYASKPTHEAEVAAIVDSIGQFKSLDDVDAYIKQKFPGSPVTADMISKTSAKYGISWEMLVAMMQEDSSMGTAGKAISTRNPGNVGNDDSGATRTYPSWQAGVDAVGEWLSNHRSATPTAAGADKKFASAVQSAVSNNIYPRLSGNEKMRIKPDSNLALATQPKEQVVEQLKTWVKSSLQPTQVTQLEGRETEIPRLDGIKTMLQDFYNKGGKSDFLKGTQEDVLRKIGMMKDPQLRYMATRISMELNTYRQSTTGLAFTESESAAYKQIFPDISSTGDLNMALLDGLIDSQKAYVDSVYSTAMGPSNWKVISGGTTAAPSSSSTSNDPLGVR
jgi:hypothetical protein